MRVDVVDVLGLETRVLQRKRHGLGRRLARLVWRDLVIRVIGGRIAQHLAVDTRSATDRVLVRLEDQNARPFAWHEAIAVAVEWAACLFWRVIARRERADGVERRDAHLAQRRFSAA